MVAPRPHGTWFIALTLVIAGMLGVMPLPPWLEVWRPEWIALVLVYWVIALPHRVGLFTAWFVGFFIDVLEGSLLGLNAVVMTLIAYVALSLYQRLRMFTPLQQSTTILMLIGVTQLLIFWVLTATGQNTPQNLIFVVSAVSSALVWPLIFVLLRFGRRALKVT
ncbi:MAG: rod shape-determining protein MreD [Pseudomonadota bacterium]|nr:rod shape-determining protein MreD [Pseudomonadota bacterium]